MPKIMPKFDAEKNSKVAFCKPFGFTWATPGGKGAGRFWLLLSDNAMTLAGVGGL